MTNAVGLIRVSTDKQASAGNGAAAQRMALEDYAKKQGLLLKEVVVEAGISGGLSLEKREGLLKAVSLLGKGDVLLISKYDRLTRDLLQLLTIERLVNRKGASIIATSNVGASGDDPSAKLMRSLLGAVASFEKEIIGIRTKEAVDARIRAGKYVGGLVPFGLMKDENKNLIPNPDEVAVLHLIQELRSAPYGKQKNRKTPWAKVANELNARGIKNRSSSDWTMANVRKVILTGERYAHLFEQDAAA